MARDFPLVDCEGKERFETWAKAEVVLVRAARRKKGRKKSARLQVYRCPHCRGYHLGSGMMKHVEDRNAECGW